MAIAGGTAEDVVGAAIGFVETGAGEVEGDVERLPCWGEANAVERINKTAGRKLEKDRRNMMIRN
jgi:hypothetical protein